MTTTISWYEVIWTLGAVPGLLLWLWNWKGAVSSLRAIRSISTGNGRLLWAQFSTLMTFVFVGIEAVFVMLGVIAMATPSPNRPTVTTWVLVTGLLGASCAITFLAYKWRAVDQQIIGAARARDEARRVTDTALHDERKRAAPPRPFTHPVDNALRHERQRTDWRSDTDPGMKEVRR